MDFFERIFGISPDAGSGTFELIVTAVLILIFALVAAYRRWRSGSSLARLARNRSLA